MTAAIELDDFLAHLTRPGANPAPTRRAPDASRLAELVADTDRLIADCRATVADVHATIARHRRAA